MLLLPPTTILLLRIKHPSCAGAAATVARTEWEYENLARVLLSVQQHACTLCGAQHERRTASVFSIAAAEGRSAALAVALGPAAALWHFVQDADLGHERKGCHEHGRRLAVLCTQTTASCSCCTARVCQFWLNALGLIVH